MKLIARRSSLHYRAGSDLRGIRSPTEPVGVIRDFLRLLSATPDERTRIILANLHTRIGTLPRYAAVVSDDDVPF